MYINLNNLVNFTVTITQVATNDSVDFNLPLPIDITQNSLKNLIPILELWCTANDVSEDDYTISII